MRYCAWCRGQVGEDEPKVIVKDQNKNPRGDKVFHAPVCWLESQRFHEEVKKLLGWEAT